MVYAGPDPSVQDRIDEYFEYGLNTISYSVYSDPVTGKRIGNGYMWNMTRQPLTKCGEGRFKGMNETTL